MIYVSTILFNNLWKKQKTNILEEDGIFVHPSKHHQNLPDILQNNPSMTCEITILGSLHPYIQVDHRNIHVHWKDIAKTGSKQWVFTWKEQDPEMILLQLGAKAGSLQRSPVGASYKKEPGKASCQKEPSEGILHNMRGTSVNEPWYDV